MLALDLCIYCLSNPVGSKEHILQSCLGARETSRFIVCQECNGGFSGPEGIDTAICKCFDVVRCMLWIFDGRAPDRRRPSLPPVQSFATVNCQSIDMLPGGRFSIAKAIAQRTGNVHEFSFANAASAAMRAEHLPRQYPEIVAFSVREKIEGLGEFDHRLLGFPDDAAKRGLTKSCFNYFATICGSQARSSEFNALRQYIRNGKRDRGVGPWEDMISDSPGPLRAPKHMIAVSSTAAVPDLIGYVSLFSTICYTVVLCRNYTGPVVDRVLVLDPWSQDSEEYGWPPRVTRSDTLNMIVRGDFSDENLRMFDLRGRNLWRLAMRVRQWTEEQAEKLRALETTENSDENERFSVGALRTAACRLSERVDKRERDLEGLARRAPWRFGST